MRMFTTIAIAATALASVAIVPQTASADQVCKEVCRSGTCVKRCTEVRGHDVDIRAERRDGPRREWREERHERPGVELHAPGIGIEVGR